MRRKPLIFTFISVLCFIEPLIKILYFKALTHFDFSIIVANIMAKDSFWSVFDFWLIFPLAGLCLIKLRKWSYFVFLFLLGYMVYGFLTYERYTWPYNSDSPFLYHYVLVTIVSLVFVAFLIPGIRRPFFDRKVRWWETKTRYKINIPCKVTGNKVVFPCEILNISKTGAFLKDSSYFKLNEKMLLEFEYGGHHFSLTVITVDKHLAHGQMGYGVKFVFKSFAQTIQVSKFIQSIKNHLVISR